MRASETGEGGARAKRGRVRAPAEDTRRPLPSHGFAMGPNPLPRSGRGSYGFHFDFGIASIATKSGIAAVANPTQSSEERSRLPSSMWSRTRLWLSR